MTTSDLDPTELGLAKATIEDMIGGEPEENAKITHDILSGADQGPRRDIVLLNAAAILSVESGDWEAGLAQARAAIDSGAALNTLNAWVEKTNSY